MDEHHSPLSNIFVALFLLNSDFKTKLRCIFLDIVSDIYKQMIKIFDNDNNGDFD